MEDTICPHPWIHVSVRNTGDLRACCVGAESKDGATLRDGNGLTLNCRTHKISDSRNSDLLRHMRKEMLEGKRPAACVGCWKAEDVGLKSARLWERRLTLDYFSPDQARKFTAPDGSIGEEFPVRTWDIRFGNQCNLKCVMCGPSDSNAWYSDFAEIHGDHFNDHDHRIQLEKVGDRSWRATSDPYNWHERSEFWQELKTHVGGAKKFYLAGGEPLLIERHYEFLKMCVDQGCASEISLVYASNVTRVTEKAIQLWQNFKRVDVACSVDAPGRAGEYIRYGSRWDAVKGNIQKLAQAPGPLWIGLNPTVSLLNIYYLPELFDWIMDENLRVAMGGHLLIYPEELSVRVLPPAVKAAVQNKIKWFFVRNRDRLKLKRWQGIAPLLRSFVVEMNSADHHHLLVKFWQRTEAIDRRRKIKIREALPELCELLSATPT